MQSNLQSGFLFALESGLQLFCKLESIGFQEIFCSRISIDPLSKKQNLESTFELESEIQKAHKLPYMSRRGSLQTQRKNDQALTFELPQKAAKNCLVR